MQLLIWKSFQSAPWLFIYFCLRQAGLSAQALSGTGAVGLSQGPSKLDACCVSLFGQPGPQALPQPFGEGLAGESRLLGHQLSLRDTLIL